MDSEIEKRLEAARREAACDGTRCFAGQKPPEPLVPQALLAAMAQASDARSALAALRDAFRRSSDSREATHAMDMFLEEPGSAQDKAARAARWIARKAGAALPARFAGPDGEPEPQWLARAFRTRLSKPAVAAIRLAGLHSKEDPHRTP